MGIYRGGVNMGLLEDICSGLLEDYKEMGKSLLRNILTEKTKAENTTDYKEKGRLNKKIRKLQVELDDLKKKSKKKADAEQKARDRMIWKD